MMNTTIFAIMFPFLAAFLTWLIFRNKQSDSHRSVLRIVMIVISVIELRVVLYYLFCDLFLVKAGPYDVGIYFGESGLGLHFTYTGFRGIFAVITAIVWFVAFLYGKEFSKKDLIYFLTLGAAVGVFYAADFFTLFFFFEIMSFTSLLRVAHGQAFRERIYFGIAAVSGMAIFMGILIVYVNCGTLVFETLGRIQIEDTDLVFAAMVSMFFGFGAQAGIFSVQGWLPTAYREKSTPVIVLLSVVLSKTGIFAIILVTRSLMRPVLWGRWGKLILIVGTAVMVLGGIMAVISRSLKTTMACFSVSQMGVVFVGIGMEALYGQMMELFAEANKVYGMGRIMELFGMARNGIFLHMINLLIIELVLFMISSVVYTNVGSYALNKVRGFGHGKPFLRVVFLLAALSVCGVPLLNGYVSRTLLYKSIRGYMEFIFGIFGMDVYLKASPVLVGKVDIFFLFSNGLTLAYMAKLFVVLFVKRNANTLVQKEYDCRMNYMSMSGKAAILLCTIPIPLIGVLPNLVADRIAGYGAEVSGGLSVLEEPVRYFSLAYFINEGMFHVAFSLVVAVVLYLLVTRFLRN